MRVSMWFPVLFAFLLYFFQTSSVAALSARPTADIARLKRTKGRYEVCISPRNPMSSCDPHQGRNVSDASGYQVSMWRVVASAMKVPSSQWYFRCLPWQAMMDDLTAPNGTCYLSASGVEISQSNMQTGIRFSWPTYKAGLKVLVLAQSHTGGTWAVLNAFHGSVWIALGLSGAMVGVLYWGIEGSIEWMRVQDAKLTKRLSGLLMLMWGFLVLVMTNVFWGGTTAAVTASTLITHIHSRSDLVGLAVGTWDGYADNLMKFGLRSHGYAWDSQADEDAMLNLLRNRSLAALVLDNAMVDFVAGQQCEFAAVGETFDSWSLAFAFPVGTNESVVTKVSETLITLQQQYGVMDDIEQAQIRMSGTCGALDHELEPLEFSQVSGVWWLLVGGVGAGSIWLLCMHGLALTTKNSVILDLLLRDRND